MSDGDGSHVFSRKPGRVLPNADRGDGAEIIDSEGRRWLDGSGSAFVAILGHSPKAVAEAISAQVQRLNFAYSGDFANAPQSRLAASLVALAPLGMAKVWLATSGSAASEAAIKLSRQYHLSKGRPGRVNLVARAHSYHGSTLGALSLTGSQPRRRPYTPYLLDSVAHVPPPLCYRCPLGLTRDSCGVACADEVEHTIQRLGAETVSAVFVEPVAGAPLAALVTPRDYMRKVREICDRYDILMVVDEIVSGLGRTGNFYAVEDSGVCPDIILLAKGLGAGYVPSGALVIHEKVARALEDAGSAFVHSESFTGHVLAGVAGCAVLDFIRDNGLLERVQELALTLEREMENLRSAPMVGDRRGKGLLQGIELVRNTATKEPFPRSLQVAERVASATARKGVLVLAGNASVDGENGDSVVVAPPYVITQAQVLRLVTTLRCALEEVAQELRDQRVLIA